MPVIKQHTSETTNSPVFGKEGLRGRRAVWQIVRGGDTFYLFRYDSPTPPGNWNGVVEMII